MPNSAPPQTGEPPNPGYETAEPDFFWILVFVVGLIATLVAAYFVLTAWYHSLERGSARTDAASALEYPITQTKSHPYFPYPREQPAPAVDLQTFLARENEKLNSYGWVDKKSGIVRIPIDRAMDLLLEKGLPTRSGTNNSAAGPTVLQFQQQRPNYGATSNGEAQ